MSELLQKTSQFFNSQLGATQNGLESSWLDGLGAVDNHRRAAREIFSVSQENVGTALSQGDETGFLKGSNEAMSRKLWQVAHAATSTSRRKTSDSGIGWRSAVNPSRYRAMASLMFTRASASVSPWLAHPGNAGAKTENPPSASGCNITVNRRTIGSPPFHRIPQKNLDSPIKNSTTFTLRLPQGRI